jgi:hypothetical protein
MDGDDTVEFFEKFAEEFKADFHDLRIHWNQHLAPEGSLSLGAMATIVAGITAGFWLRGAVGIIPAWAWGIVLIAVVQASPWTAAPPCPCRHPPKFSVQKCLCHRSLESSICEYLECYCVACLNVDNLRE